MPISGDIIDRLQTVGVQVVLFTLTFLVMYLAGRLGILPIVRRILTARQVNPTIREPGLRTMHLIIILVGVWFGLAVADFPRLLTASSTLAAAIALAIGFAARDVIGNFVSGVFIIFDPKFNVGDIINWNDKEGVVEDISFRVTRVRTFDNKLMSVPNIELTTTTVTNVTAKERRRLSVMFRVSYSEDLEEAVAIVQEAITDNKRIVSRPTPQVQITELAPSYVGLTALIWIRSTAPDDEVLSSFRKTVKQRFDEAGIEMPYPYRRLSGGVKLTRGVADEILSDE